MPQTFKDARGVLWAYYLRLICWECGPAYTAHLIDPTGSTLKCGSCRRTSPISARDYHERIAIS